MSEVSRENLVAVDELAAWLGLSERGVRRLVAAGRLPHYRAGARIRFDLAEVREALRRADAVRR